jgi:hypothetical protein
MSIATIAIVFVSVIFVAAIIYSTKQFLNI